MARNKRNRFWHIDALKFVDRLLKSSSSSFFSFAKILYFSGRLVDSISDFFLRYTL